MSELSNFIALVKSTGIATSQYYSVSLPPMDRFNTENVNIMCNASGMPDVTMTASESKIYGESSMVVNGVTYGELQLSFLVTNDFDVIGYFESWANDVYNRSTRNVGYYKDYVKPITVAVLDKNGKIRYEVIYFEAWPKTIGASGLSYDSHSPMIYNVTLAYKFWESAVGPATKPDGIPWDGTPFILPEASGLSTGVGLFGNFGGGLTSTGLLGQFGNIGAAAAGLLGPQLGSNILGASNDFSGAIQSLTNLGDGTPVGSLLSQYASQLGTSGSVMGFGIGQLGQNLTSIIAPAGAIANGAAGISMSITSMDNLLQRMGIHTNLGNSASTLAGIAGQVSVLSQLNGIPGAMGSLGASIGSISGDLVQVQQSLVNVPGASSAIQSTLGTLSNVFNTSGNQIGSLSSMTW